MSIFISYAHEDRDRAERLTLALEPENWKIFWDPQIRAGSDWRKSIGKHLEAAKCVIVLWSKSSIDSHWVMEEAEDAQKRGILVPVLIDDVEPPFGFRSVQAANLSQWDGTSSDAFFRNLVRDITEVLRAQTGRAVSGWQNAQSQPASAEAKQPRETERSLRDLEIAELGHAPSEPVRRPANNVLPDEEYSEVFFQGPAYALIVGISDYKNSPGLGVAPGPGQFANLKFAAKDATDFKDFLTHHGFIPENIKPLINEAATLKNIKAGLRELRTNCAQSGSNSLVIVYFSGHGVADPDSNHYLVPWEGEKDELAGTCLWNKEFQNYLDGLKTNRLVVFLDACDAGGYLEGAKSGGEPAVEFDAHRDLGEGTGRCIIASCKPGERSWEGPANGIFTGHLLELLRAETDDIKDEEIDIFNLYPPLKRKVMETARRMYNHTQEPTVSDFKGTGIVLAINRKVAALNKKLRSAADQKRTLFLDAICERLDRQEFVSDLKAPISAKLRSYVTTGKQFEHHNEFYRLFETYSSKCEPDDFDRVDECVTLLINSHQRAFDATTVIKKSPTQEVKTEDKLDLPQESKVPGGDKLQTVSASATPSDQQEASWHMPTTDRDHILEEISPQPKYFKETFSLRKLLSRPVTQGEFMAKIFELGESNEATDFPGILEEIVMRFQECWSKPRKNAPQRLSDFRMTNR
jgi:hypothetical protein